MTDLFVVLSGEHHTLPIAEVRSILEAEEFRYKILEVYPQVLVIGADEKCAKILVNRGGYVKVVCRKIAHSTELDTQSIIKSVEKADFSAFISPGETFHVRILRIQGVGDEADKLLLERKLGAVIYTKIPNLHVRFENPDKIFLGVLTDGIFLFGLKLEENTEKFSSRRPSKRPVFHPSTMTPKLARCLVNLTRIKRGELLFDPFCGVGGIAIEGGLIGCEILCSDIREDMSKGSLVNLRHYGVEPIGVLVADAKKLPYRKCRYVITDHPYGRSATTRGVKTDKLVDSFLENLSEIMERGGYLCLVSMKGLNVVDLAKQYGFELVEYHELRIHKSLTRVIYVFKKGVANQNRIFEISTDLLPQKC